MFLRQASWIAVDALSVAALALFLTLRPDKPRRGGFRPGVESSVREDRKAMLPLRSTAALLAGLTAVIGFSLTSLSSVLWKLPELNLVQFPWRQLTVLFVVLCLAMALALHKALGAQHGGRLLLAGVALALPLALLSVHSYRRGSVEPHFEAYLSYLAAHEHGFLPTPEYTVAGVSDAILGANDPAYWLAATPDAPPPGIAMHSAPAHMDPNFLPGWGPATTISQPAPRHLTLNLSRPQVLVLHLRAYPNWRLFRNGVAQSLPLRRRDGLIAIPLPAGASAIDLRWQSSTDQYLGGGLSLLAAVGMLTATRRRTRANQLHGTV